MEMQIISGGNQLPSYVNPKPSFSGVSCVYEAWKWAGNTPLWGVAKGDSCICIPH